MDICKNCRSYGACDESKYSFDFIRRIMIASSIISYRTLIITHQDEADELGYNLDELLEFTEENRKNCYFYETESFYTGKLEREAI